LIIKEQIFLEDNIKNDKPKIVVICGPTASGKTALGIKVAQQANGEIISSDSMQIYKDMDIGTAKPTPEERAQAVHHLVDFVSPDQRYSVADFKKDATEKIEDILSRGKLPIIVGGTGLYVNSLIHNIEYKEEITDIEYRNELEKVDLETLYKQAQEIDPEAAAKVSQNDRKRITRILEIYHTTGKTKTQMEAESRKEVKYDYKIFVLTPERDKLYERINLRVDLMMQAGLVDEVKQLLQKYNEFPTAMQGLGYKEVKEYLDGEITEEEMVEKIKQESRHYAKRQLTWFRQYKDATWLDTFDENNVNIILDKLKG
jgi:tRNA dimethylallyltransferase